MFENECGVENMEELKVEDYKLYLLLKCIIYKGIKTNRDVEISFCQYRNTKYINVYVYSVRNYNILKIDY